jgi:hypothetical protein
MFRMIGLRSNAARVLAKKCLVDSVEALQDTDAESLLMIPGVGAASVFALEELMAARETPMKPSSLRFRRRAAVVDARKCVKRINRLLDDHRFKNAEDAVRDLIAAIKRVQAIR